jgi:hypothetical protein
MGKKKNLYYDETEEMWIYEPMDIELNMLYEFADQFRLEAFDAFGLCVREQELSLYIAEAPPTRDSTGMITDWGSKTPIFALSIWFDFIDEEVSPEILELKIFEIWEEMHKRLRLH